MESAQPKTSINRSPLMDIKLISSTNYFLKHTRKFTMLQNLFMSCHDILRTKAVFTDIRLVKYSLMFASTCSSFFTACWTSLLVKAELKRLENKSSHTHVVYNRCGLLTVMTTWISLYLQQVIRLQTLFLRLFNLILTSYGFSLIYYFFPPLFFWSLCGSLKLKSTSM